MRILLDTSVVIDPTGADLPDEAEVAISAVTVAELGYGVVRARDDTERARRTLHLQRVRALFEELPVDGAVAEAYAVAALAVSAGGRSPRPRAFDLMIAATAIAHGLPFATRDLRDVAALRHLLDILPVPARA